MATCNSSNNIYTYLHISTLHISMYTYLRSPLSTLTLTLATGNPSSALSTLYISILHISTHIYTVYIYTHLHCTNLHISTLHTEHTDPDPGNPSSARASECIQQLLLCYRRDNLTISCSSQHAPLLHSRPRHKQLCICLPTPSCHLHLMGLTTQHGNYNH